MPAYVFVVILAAWLIWMTPFFLIKRGAKTPQKVDRRARWGIVLEAIAFSLVWQSHFWIREPGYLRLVLGGIFLTLGGMLSWTSARTLGRQWRFDAGLNADHQLVQTGAYRAVRHPIYTSMLCMLLGTGFLITPLLLLVIAAVIFVAGTEIRVRIEDALLASRFGAEFEDYRRRVPAYLPLGRTMT